MRHCPPVARDRQLYRGWSWAIEVEFGCDLAQGRPSASWTEPASIDGPMAASASRLVPRYDVVVQVGLDDLADAGALAVGQMAVAAERDKNAGVELVGHPHGIFMGRGRIPCRTDHHNGRCPAGRDLRQLGRRSDRPQRTYQI